MTAIEWIQAFFGARSLPVFLVITDLGSEYAYIVLLTLYYWLVDPWTGRQLGLLVGLSYGFNTLVKEAIDSPRPFILNPKLASPDAIETIESASFPSGHTQGSATFWFFVAWHHHRVWLWLVSAIVVTAIGISRLYLGVHFPIDVVGGLLLGLLFVWGGMRWKVPQRQGILVPAIAVFLAFILSVIYPKFARSLGVIIGFFLTRPNFSPPSTWKKRFLFGGVGLVCVLAFYVFSKWLFSFWPHGDWMSFWRYCAITLVATQVWPRLMRGKIS